MISHRLRLLAGIMVSLAGIVVAPTYAAAPEPIVEAVSPPTSTPETTTTTSTVPAPPAARCPMWWSLARSVGFTVEQMQTLDRVIHRESRCQETALNATDPNGGSIGLTQINRFWCLPSRYHADGYLQAVGVLTTCDDLYIAEINLRAALALMDYSRRTGQDQWAQWAWL